MAEIFECTYADSGYGRRLSNLNPYVFDIDGFRCASMEGFLQSLKTEKVGPASALRQMYGHAAWREGQAFTSHWQSTQTLWWQGQPINRQSVGYQNLLNRAYEALSENKDFAMALLNTGDGELTHSIGSHDSHVTLLTKAEFMFNLYRVRAQLFEKHGSVNSLK